MLCKTCPINFDRLANKETFCLFKKQERLCLITTLFIPMQVNLIYAVFQIGYRVIDVAHQLRLTDVRGRGPGKVFILRKIYTLTAMRRKEVGITVFCNCVPVYTGASVVIPVICDV